MEAAQWERLETVMARMAAGDRAAVVTLYVEFGRVLSGVVRRHLGRLGMGGVGREDLDGLVLDACFAIDDCASGWRPDAGVPPWTWADRRIAAAVSAWVGQHADVLGDELVGRVAPAAGPGVEAPPLELLRSHAHPMCRLLRDAFAEAGVSTRDQQLLVETGLQASLGDPAPSSSVAALYDMKPAAVRQAVKRAKDRLRRLAAAEPAYAPLGELRLLA